jgi:hypothetical protein
MLELKIDLATPGGMRLWRVIVVSLGLSILGVVVVGELLFRRWAPWASDQGMSALVAMVWAYNLLPIFRRQGTVLGGLGRGLLYTAGTAALIAGALYLVR